ncbi:O-antigen translocase [Flavobacterium sp. UMI-01]|uniref:O-antigen translocase n=1 Tax=Flavobacterium sp. UMI-01 TaxID=1441053 RepID=UPI0027E4A211|nr:O-antigen translocase [Flavobacterium sp. UMI-01]
MILKFLKTFLKTELFRISSLNSLNIFFRIVTGLVTSKLLAIYVGPSGMALVGNLKNFMSSLESVATLGFQNGIVKYVAEIQDDNEKYKKFITTVFITLIAVAVTLSVILFFGAHYFSSYIFGDKTEYQFIVRVMALSLPWYSVSVFLLAVINGLQQFKRVIWISIIGNLISFVFTLFLVTNFKVIGALLVSVIIPALLFFIAFYFIDNKLVFIKNIRWHIFDIGVIKNLSSYSLMALFSGVMGSLIYLSIRNNMIDKLGINTAGYWETMSRLSSYYMLFVSTILTVYFFPRLVIAKNNEESKAVFWSFYKNIIPIFSLGLVCIYFLRYFIINWFLTKEFTPIADLFLLQLISDFFKVISLILGYEFLAKKMTKIYLFFEIASYLLLYFLSDFLLSIYGVKGVLMAQFIENATYFVLLAFYFRKSLF